MSRESLRVCCSSTISFTSTTTTKDSLDNKIIYHDKPHSVSLRSSKNFRNHEHEDEDNDDSANLFVCPHTRLTQLSSTMKAELEFDRTPPLKSRNKSHSFQKVRSWCSKI